MGYGRETEAETETETKTERAPTCHHVYPHERDGC